MINALALTIFGFSSSLIGGILGDVLEKKTMLIKSLIIIFGNTMATPLLGVAVFTSNFWLAIICAALMILVSGAYYGPAVTMMQNTTRPDQSGLVVSASTFYNTLTQTVAPIIFSALALHF